MLGGGLLLTALLCLPVWQTALRLLRDGRVGCELCAGVTVLADLLCCVSGAVTGSTLSTPYAAAGALLLLSCQLGLYLDGGDAPHRLPSGGCQRRTALCGVRSARRYLQAAGCAGRLLPHDHVPRPRRQWRTYVLPLR